MCSRKEVNQIENKAVESVPVNKETQYSFFSIRQLEKRVLKEYLNSNFARYYKEKYTAKEKI